MRLRWLKDFLNFLPSESTAKWAKIDRCDPKKPTIILVSGFAASHRTLSVIRRRFLKDGFNVIVLSMDWQKFSDSIRGLYRMAEELSTAVLQIKKMGIRKTATYLVGHSAGGLVARYYVQQLGGYHYCDALITLGTPHKGTWLAVLGFFSHLLLKFRCLFEILPISPFMKQLNAATYPPSFKLVSISSADDVICHGPASKLPLPTPEKVEELTLRHLTHSDFLLSKSVYDAMKKRIAA